jgi:hypothetical protein
LHDDPRREGILPAKVNSKEKGELDINLRLFLSDYRGDAVLLYHDRLGSTNALAFPSHPIPIDQSVQVFADLPIIIVEGGRYIQHQGP